MPLSHCALVVQPFTVCVQVPKGSWHVSTVFGSPSLQLVAVPATHLPLTHFSTPLQALMSAQSKFAMQSTRRWAHALLTGSHESTV